MEQVSGDEQKIGLHLPGLCDDLGKCILDSLCPLPGLGLVAVRSHAPVDIGCVDKFHVSSSFVSAPNNYSSQLLTVLGKGITSRILDIPVRYITQRSNPNPNPEWRVEPYLRRSR